jgi:hypothetical protein
VSLAVVPTYQRIRAKRAGECSRCAAVVEIGDEIDWCRGVGAVCLRCAATPAEPEPERLESGPAEEPEDGPSGLPALLGTLEAADALRISAEEIAERERRTWEAACRASRAVRALLPAPAPEEPLETVIARAQATSERRPARVIRTHLGTIVDPGGPLPAVHLPAPEPPPPERPRRRGDAFWRRLHDRSGR